MKIQKIQKITDFGIYKDFSLDQKLPNFEKFNLIYGWNYSGKTTLSRIFDFLGNPSEINIQRKGYFEVLDSNNQLLVSSNAKSPQNCKVFNRDFIDRNFRQVHSAPAVFIVGDDAVKIRDRIETLETRKKKLIKENKMYKREESNWIRRIRMSKTNVAYFIKELVSEQTIDIPSLDQFFEQNKDSLDDHILESTAFNNFYAIANSSDEFAKHNFTIPNIDIFFIIDNVSNLLGQTASNNAIGRLKNDAKLEEWVRTGRELHSPGNECAFCGNTIQDERYEQLKGHFSTAYEALVKAVKDEASNLQIQIEADLPESSLLIQNVRKDYTEAKSVILSFVKDINNLYPLLINALEGKVSSIETEQILPDTVSNALKDITAYVYADQYAKIDELLNFHNEQIANIDKTKQDAKNKLKNHIAALFYRDNKIADEEKEFAEIKKKLNKAIDLRAKTTEQIQAKKAELNEHSIAVEKLNELITMLLTGSNISAVQLSETEFEFQRGSEPAVYMSDGERTAIAFAYFLVTIEDGNNNLGDTLVFVDDPISSLDSNHIYAVYALIINKLKGQCSQLFVSTHNYEFLNLLKDESNEKDKFKSGCAGYLVQRKLDDQGVLYADLIEMPEALRKFKSEYHFLFSLLHNIVSSEKPTIHEEYASPTILRKFLETYLGFRKPTAGRWSRKLDLLFDNEVERVEVTKFANDASHSQSLKLAVEHGAYISSAKTIVQKVLDALKNKDKSHYDGLLENTIDRSNA